MYVLDTIAAIATPPGEGGIAIVRISGPDSLRIADKVFRGKGIRPSERPSHVILHGYVHDDDGSLIDEVLLLIMRAPHSYTCEDVVEIHGHGGPIPAKRILRRVISAGARLAEPGEFTKRAFLNGRLDLVQAEAVLDLIRAKTDRAARAAAEQLSGNISSYLSDTYAKILRVLADIEATLDFPEDELPETVIEDIISRLTREIVSLQSLLASWSEGRLLRDGGRIAITGKPNVGKSSLFNALVGRNRAIVSKHPGTTRDVVEDWISIEGIPFCISDTAGMRDSQCEIEKEGVRRAHDIARAADVILHVFDLSSDFDERDKLQVSNMVNGVSIAVLNKADLPRKFNIRYLPANIPRVETSALTGTGLTDVRSAVMMTLHVTRRADNHHIAISERHRNHIQKALDELESATKNLSESGEQTTDIAAHHVRGAVSLLAEILGRSYSDELLDTIFARFCIGK